MNIDDVLDVKGGVGSPDTPVIAWPRHDPPRTNQQWQFIPAPAEPGWWYLQALMGSGHVMTLKPDSSSQSSPVVMLPQGSGDASLQLSCLVPRMTLGYWLSQSQQVVSNEPAVVVIGVSDNGDAITTELSYDEYKRQAWGFSPTT